MGGSASSKLATGEEAKISEQSMTNVGLVNLADTGESTGFTFNVVEAATCGIAFLILVLYQEKTAKSSQNAARDARGNARSGC